MERDSILEVEVRPDADDNHIVGQRAVQVCNAVETTKVDTIGVTAEALLGWPNLCDDCRQVLEWHFGDYEPEFDSHKHEARSQFGRSLEQILKEDGLFDGWNSPASMDKPIYGAALAGATLQEAREASQSYRSKYIGAVCDECNEVHPKLASDSGLLGVIKEASCGHVVEVDAREYRPGPEHVLQGYESGTTSHEATSGRLLSAELPLDSPTMREVQVYSAKGEVKFHDIDDDIDELATLCGYPASESLMVAVETLDIAECGNCGRQRLSAKKAEA